MVRFVIGRSGSGKTEYCFSKIKEAVAEGQAEGEKQVLLITPEQYNFTAQKRLLKDLGESGINCVENSSFSRLYREVVRLQGGAAEEISNGTKVVMMKKAISNANANAETKLKIIDVEKMHSSFVKSLLQLYQEIKDYGNTINQISDAAESLPPEEVELSNKLSDIALIFTEYEKLLGDLQLDPACRLEELCRQLVATNGSYLAGRAAFIDGFSMFTESEYKIIELIFKYCKDVTVTLCMDPDSQSAANKGYGLFGNVRETYERLKNIAKHIGCEISNDNIILLNENKRTEKEDLKFIEQNLFSHIDKQFKDPQDIEIYSARDLADECDYVSIKICDLLRNSVSPGDITVICRNKGTYEGELLYDFRKYNIPYLYDERQPVLDQPLMVFIHYLLNVVIYDFRSEDIISLAKTGLFPKLSTRNVEYLENYVYVWGIDGYDQWKEPFTAPPEGLVEKRTDEGKNNGETGQKDNADFVQYTEESRKYLFGKLDKFKKDVDGASALDIGKAVYNLLVELDECTDKDGGEYTSSINARLKNITNGLRKNGKDQLADEQGEVWKIAMRTLNQLAVLFDEERISLREYSDMFNLMVSCEDLGAAPQGLNCVNFISADKICMDSSKYVFILGANENEFPAAYKGSGILTESDRRNLNDKLKLRPDAVTVNLQERFYAYKSVSLAGEKLTVCHCGSGSEVVPSTLVISLQGLFEKSNLQKHQKQRWDLKSLDLIESPLSAFELMAKHFEDNDEFYASLKEYFSSEENYKNVDVISLSDYRNVESMSSDDKLEIEDKEKAKELFGETDNEMYLSASRIEEYYKCPFMYFCNYGLNAKPIYKVQMDPMKTGTITHYVLEKAIGERGSEGIKNIDDDGLEQLVKKYLYGYINDQLDPKVKASNEFKRNKEFSHNLDKLLYPIFSTLSKIRSEFKQDSFGFESVGYEVKIEKDGEVEPQEIKLKDGSVVKLKGKIDRVDMYTEDGENYVRIVDYKTGKKEFRLSDVLSGLNLQMLIYLSTVCQYGQEDTENTERNKYYGIPAGILYMHAAQDLEEDDSYDDENSNTSSKKEDPVYSGVVLCDEKHGTEILEAMEPSLEGKFIPPKQGEKNAIEDNNNVVTLEEFNLIFKQVDKLIKNMGENLHNGQINPYPIDTGNQGDPCQFCDYSAICDFRKKKEKNDVTDFYDRAFQKKQVFEKLAKEEQ